eukprot:gene31583-36143_t
MSRVRFTEAALAEVEDALAWFDDHNPEIVPGFRRALQSLVSRIESRPQQFPQVRPGTRRALMRRFPYVILFRETAEACCVIAIFHPRRDPKHWETRSS